MVEADARYGDALYGLHGGGGVPAPSHAALEHGHVHVRLGEHHARRNGEQVELGDVIGSLARRRATRVHAPPCLLGRHDAAREGFLGDGVACHLHALGVAHQLGRGVERRAKPLATQNSRRKARG